MIHIVTDTTANVPIEELEKYHVAQVPVFLYFGSESFRERFDISTAEVFKRLGEGQSMSTAEPPVHDFEAVFKQIREKEPEADILAIMISSLLSGTTGSAQTAAAQLADPKLHVYDTRVCSIGHALMVLEAAHMAEQGAGIDAVLARLNELRDHLGWIFALETLGPMAASGRLWRLSRMATTLGKMKPMITMKEGTWDALDKYPRAEDAILKLIEHIRTAPRGAKLRMGIAHGDRYEDACKLAETVRSEFQPISVVVTEVSPAFAFYFSRGALGIAWHS